MPQVGKNVARLDGVDKVTGRALYTDDIKMPGMWHGAVVRTTIPYGRVKSVELDPAFDWSQVVTADAKDIPGKNFVAMVEEDLPLIVDDVTRHIGEAVLLIAAPTRELALEARKHVKVEYEDWEPLLTVDESKRAQTKLHGDDNVIAHYTIVKGDSKKGFEKADRIVGGIYSTGYHEHMYIEPQAMIAAPRDGGGFDVIGSMQCPFYVSKAAGIIMGVSEDALAVRQAVVGGAFGGKEDYPSVLAGYALVLAKKAGRPIKITYDRDEDTEVTTKRHPARVHHRTGVKDDGTITAMDIKMEMDAGAYVTLTPVVLSRGAIHAAGPYRCENIKIDAIAYATNTNPNGAFRGFGVPQACFPIELHIDRIAAELNISPLELRKKNCLRVGDTTATGQKLEESVGGMSVLKEAAGRSGFAEKFEKHSKGGGNKRRGIGMSFFMHGAGFTGSGEATLKGKAGLRCEPDGTVTVLTACTEMGQGAHTVLPQMAADSLGVDISCVGIETPDTSIVPNSGPTVASRTTMIMGSVLEKCAAKLKERLKDFARESGRGEVGLSRELIKEYVKAHGALTVIDEYTLPPGISWDEKTHRGDAYPTYSWGCDVAEVEVDMDTFEVAIKKMWLAADVGRAINPILAEGQIEGGTLQALGYAIMERHQVEGGAFKTNRMQTYMIPTCKDAPEMETAIVEEEFSYGPMGAKGVGELPMDGGAPAIVNAIANATGLHVDHLPATPERLFEEWKKRQ